MNAASDNAISVTSVTKIFRTGVIKKKTAVHDLTFSVARGEVVGLLGANGSGKSTTIKMIAGFLKPTEGELLVCGVDSEERKARSFIGYLPENPRFQKFLTAQDVMTYYGKLLGMKKDELGKRIDFLLELVNLKHVARERIQGFSKGMTQRLAIAQSLLNQPPVLIFDEPMSGLDPLGRLEIRNLIFQIHDEMPSTTIFFSTHILNDVEQVCSSVVLLKKGKLTRQCRIDELLADNSHRFDVIVQNLPASMKSLVAPNTRQSPVGTTLSIEGADQLIARLAELRRSGATIVGLSSHRRSLEEALFAEGEFSRTESKEPLKAETGT